MGRVKNCLEVATGVNATNPSPRARYGCASALSREERGSHRYFAVPDFPNTDV